MKHVIGMILSACGLVMLLGYLGYISPGGVQAVAAPPLSLEGFLDEKLPEAPAEEEKIKADNESCYVCHGNYREEKFVLWHGKEDVGCIDCHGKSYEHRDDEDNITPPDKMYPLDAIKKCCEKCHEDHDAPARKVIARWRERCPEKTDPKTIVCTDCHGQHRLKMRVVRWNKKTGELLFRKKETAEGAPEKAASEKAAPKKAASDEAKAN